MDATGKLTLETPEQIGIEFELGGIGSRFLAALLDLLCMLVFLVAAVIFALAGIEGRDKVLKQMGQNAARSEALTNGLSATTAILLLLSVFLVQWGYYIVAELLMKGASPGKRAMGLRVIRDNGMPIGFSQSLLRNLVRLVDFLPWGYGIGLVAMFVSPRAQRLGDLVASTLVVRVDKAPRPLVVSSAMAAAAPSAPRLLSVEERHLVEQFFQRSTTLLPAARANLLTAIATPLRERLAARNDVAAVVGAIAHEPDEAWLRLLLDLDRALPGQSPQAPSQVPT